MNYPMDILVASGNRAMAETGSRKTYNTMGIRGVPGTVVPPEYRQLCQDDQR